MGTQQHISNDQSTQKHEPVTRVVAPLGSSSLPSAAIDKAEIQRTQSSRNSPPNTLVSTGKPLTAAPELLQEALVKLCNVLSKPVTKTSYGSAAHNRGELRVQTTTTHNIDGILSVLESVPDKQKGDFLKLCEQNTRILGCDLKQEVSTLTSANDEMREIGQRALYGFDAERQARVILSNRGGFGRGWADTKAIMAAVDKLAPDQVSKLDQQMDGKLESVIKEQITGLDQATALKRIGKADPSNAATLLSGANLTKEGVSRVIEVIETFPNTEDRIKVFAKYRELNQGKALVAAFEQRDKGAASDLVESIDPNDKHIVAACKLYSAADSQSEIQDILKQYDPADRAKLQEQYNNYFSPSLTDRVSKIGKPSERLVTFALLEEKSAPPETTRPVKEKTITTDLAAESAEVATSVETEPIISESKEDKPEPESVEKVAALSMEEEMARAMGDKPNPSSPTPPKEEPAKVDVPPAAPTSEKIEEKQEVPKASFAVRYTDHNNKPRMLDEHTVAALIANNFVSEVKEFAKNSNYPNGWENEIAKLVRDEALKGKDLSSANVKLSNRELAEAGKKVWQRMQEIPLEVLIVDGTAQRHGLGSYSNLVNSEYPEHQFIGKMVESIAFNDAKPVQSYIETLSEIEKQNLRADLASWKKNSVLNEKQIALLDRALGYLPSETMEDLEKSALTGINEFYTKIMQSLTTASSALEFRSTK